MEGERHVLTIEEPPVIRRVLKALSAGFNSESGQRQETRSRLEDFSKQSFEALILNLRVIEEPLEAPPGGIRRVGASLVGGVLVVVCHATRPWIARIEELRNHQPFTKSWTSGVRAMVRAIL